MQAYWQSKPKSTSPVPVVHIKQEHIEDTTPVQDFYDSHDSLPTLSRNLSESVINEKEKWSPYKNFLVFVSSVLLWHKPVVAIPTFILVNIIVWYSSVIFYKWGMLTYLCLVIAVGIVTDLLCNLGNFSFAQFFSLFPDTEHEQVSYDEVMQQYVLFKKYIRNTYQQMCEFRRTQHVQFTITASFCLLLFICVHPLINGFFAFYVIFLSVLLGPGLWHNDIPQRIFLFSRPHVITAYQQADTQLKQIISKNQSNPGVNAVANVVPPASSRSPLSRSTSQYAPRASNGAVRPSVAAAAANISSGLNPLRDPQRTTSMRHLNAGIDKLVNNIPSPIPPATSSPYFGELPNNTAKLRRDY